MSMQPIVNRRSRFFDETEMGASPYLTPATIKSKIESVARQVLTLSRDIREHCKARIQDGTAELWTFAKSWENFLSDFKNWYDSSPSDVWSSTYDRAEDYERELARYWDAFTYLGGKTTLPRPAPPPADAMARYVPMIYIGLGVAGLWALSKIIGSVASTGAFDRERKR